MKTALIIVIILLIMITGTYYEQRCIKTLFAEMEYKLQEVYDKFEAQEGTIQDIQEVSDFWDEEKKVLHTLIPHNDIRDIEKIFSEAIELKKNDLNKLALAKVRVLMDISRAIPEGFKLSWENIF